MFEKMDLEHLSCVMILRHHPFMERGKDCILYATSYLAELYISCVDIWLKQRMFGFCFMCLQKYLSLFTCIQSVEQKTPSTSSISTCHVLET